jgi:hypothetical protein
MNPEDEILWQKIKAFPIDDERVSLSFSDRLARDNGWTKRYALRVVEEYRRFLLLCCTAKDGVTPSDPVDQAWHLHLTYTRSYWVNLCRDTLQKELHHHPTKGGESEARKFDALYTNAHDIYRDKFGEEPPGDIWQDNKKRFTDTRFRRINLREYWLIKKPHHQLKRSIILFGVVLFAFAFIQAMFDTASYLFMGFLVLFIIVVYRQRGKGGDNSGCSHAGCVSDSGQGNRHDSSGCSTESSGCSGSDCSGCGGGD